MAIIASETTAQKQFLEENPSIGKSFALGDVEKLTEIINNFYNDRRYLNVCKNKSLKLTKKIQLGSCE
ncbi:MAG: hypothetical protein EAZ53_09015 [Bacteroidetes bacterium]|nr:MAG: hypothetical protein EAZ53_09015 [Bacteroidota bacterium]